MALTPWSPSAASPARGRFQRDWIVPELTQENATQKGVIYRSPDGQLVYTSIDRLFPELSNPLEGIPEDAETLWSVRRYPVVHGRTRRCSTEDYPVLADAIAAVSAEQRASIEKFGPVPESEWPEDREVPWTMVFSYFASPPRPGSPRSKDHQVSQPPASLEQGRTGRPAPPHTESPMGGADPTNRETTDE